MGLFLLTYATDDIHIQILKSTLGWSKIAFVNQWGFFKVTSVSYFFECSGSEPTDYFQIINLL